MKQQYKKFPYFKQGELLTSESLNNSFLYNDEQVRMSRIRLFGYGILKGLEFNFSNGSFTLCPGEAIMPDGTFVIIDSKMVFTKAVALDNSYYRLYQSTEKVQNTCKLPDALQSYTVVLTADHSHESLSHCTGMSCDMSTSKQLYIHIELRKDYKPETQACEINPTPNFVFLKQYTSCLLNINLIHNRQKELFNDNTSIVAKGLLTLCRIINPSFLSRKIIPLQQQRERISLGQKALIPLHCWRNLFEKAQEVAKDLYNAYKSYSVEWHISKIYLPAYYFQHLEYMAVAINECIAYYNEFAMQYPIIPIYRNDCANELYLGLTNASRDQQNKYRSIFYHSNQDNMQFAARKLERMMNRVIMMVKCFIGGTDFNNGTMKLVWDNPAKPLCNRPIPYFYKEDDGLISCWAAPNAYSQEQYYNYWTTTSTPECNFPGDARLLLQGFYKQNIDNVVNILEKYISDNSLDIEIEKIKLVKKTLRKENIKFSRDSYATIVNNAYGKPTRRSLLNSLNIRQPNDNKPSIRINKKIPRSFKTFESFINKSSFNISNYTLNASINKEMPIKEVLKFNTITQKISPKDCVDYLHIKEPSKIDIIKWNEEKEKSKSPEVNAFLALQSYYEKSYITQYKNIEYMHGCKNGTKLLLFYYDNRFFFEGEVKK